MNNLCPQCGYGNRDLARFCAECGASLALIDLAAPNEVLAALLVIEGAAAANSTPANSDADLLAVFDPVADDAGLPAEALQGADVVAGRYVVLDSTTDDAGRQVLTVEDHGVCRACGAEIEPAEEEPFCTNCGAQWQLLAAPWPVYLLVADVSPEDEEGQVAWAGQTYGVVAVPGYTPTDDAAEAATAGNAETSDVFVPRSSLLAGQRSDVGTARAGRNNEDSLFALTLTVESAAPAAPALGLYVVADGMGGHLDGEVASSTACAVVSTALLQALAFPSLPKEEAAPETVETAILGAIQAANRRIVELAVTNDSNMGTTLVLALVLGRQVYLANVGDSRAYLWGREGLHQVTADHSHVFKLMTNGVIAEEEIYSHPRRNEIYRSLGTGLTVEIDHFQEVLQAGDTLLLCSDGLWEMLRNEGIADVLELNLGDPQVICDELVRRANLAGGEDNISVIVVRAVR